MQPHHHFRLGELIALHVEDWLPRQRKAGKVAAGAIALLGKLIEQGTSKTLLELDVLAGEYILDHGCQATFYQYHGFPGYACLSVNTQLVHGVPTERILQEGDLITVDLGATFNGGIADTASTFIAGGKALSKQDEVLLQSTKEALLKGISVAANGHRVGEIGQAIYKSARANGFEVIVPYGGHGIFENRVHAPPFVANRAQSNEGVRLRAGMSIAIEPLLTTGSAETWISEDRWTVNTKNKSCHEEHTIYIHENSTEIMTLREGEMT